MARDKWVINEDGWIFRIQWYLAADGDFGATFGDGTPGQRRGFFSIDDDDDEDRLWALGHNAGVEAVLAAKLGQLGSMGFIFDTLSKARKALALLGAAMKTVKDKQPWPQWALQAKAAGWRAPRGWKP